MVLAQVIKGFVHTTGREAEMGWHWVVLSTWNKRGPLGLHDANDFINMVQADGRMGVRT